jgi:hypothetical protein
MENEVGEGELNYNTAYKLNQLGFGHVKPPNLSKARSAGLRVATGPSSPEDAGAGAGFAVMAVRCRAL